jgi:hypothetical protein
MECRPNSNPEQRTADIPPASPVPPLTEHFAVKRAINLWTGRRITPTIRSFSGSDPTRTTGLRTENLHLRRSAKQDFITPVSEPPRNPTYIIHFTLRKT